MKILVAEDDSFSREVVVRVLRKWGYEVTAVVDGWAAWDILQEKSAPQIAILDWRMPGLDGLELCRRLRGREESAATYLIMLTAATHEGSMVEALESGADDVIRKPFETLELRARIGVGRRVVGLWNRLGQKVKDLREVLRERDSIEQSLRQSEHYLKSVMAAVPAGVLVCEDSTGQITDANPVAEKLLDLPVSRLRGQPYRRFFRNCHSPEGEHQQPNPMGMECESVSAEGRAFHARLTRADACIGDQNLKLFSFLDVSDTRRLLDQQHLDLATARNLLQLINTGVPRWIGLNEEAVLHSCVTALSSQKAGGDHCWVRTLPARGERGPVTVVAVRDQSGHEVSCILRSIATDLIHTECMGSGLGLQDQVLTLNNRLRASGLFAEDEYLTALTLELDHATLRLRYVACGHPPMFLIRQGKVIPLPESGGPGSNLPLGIVELPSVDMGECQLRLGDRLLLYTDGLLELGGSCGGGLLTVERLRQTLQGLVEASPDLPVSGLIGELLLAARGQCDRDKDSPPDDMTVLGLEVEPTAGQHEIVVRPANIRELDSSVMEIHERVVSDWRVTAADSAFGLRLLLDEALANAWFHGNKQNPSLPIRVRWGRRNGYSLEVEDAGAGFDSLRPTDPCSPEGLLEENGRGLYLMQRSCEWLGWKKKGARLVARVACPQGETAS